MKKTAILLAAGSGQRMGTPELKQYLPIGGEPMFLRSLRTFLKVPCFSEIILVVKEGEEERTQEILDKAGLKDSARIITGGAERYDSVCRAIHATDADYVAIHDCARPFVTAQIITDVLSAAQECGAATAAVPTTDTIKIEDGEGYVKETIRRAVSWNIQTPQAFEREKIVSAYKKAYPSEMDEVTDDCMLIERYGLCRVRLVTGSYENRKITTAFDLH